MSTPSQFHVTYKLKRIGTNRWLTVRVTNKGTQRLHFVLRYRQVKGDGAITNKSHIDIRDVDPGETMERDADLYWALDWKRTEVYEVAVSDKTYAASDTDYVVVPAKYIVTKSMCFVATACLGFDDPAVAFLRAFRDNRLSASATGRGFIAVYERIGPAAAEYIARHPAVRQVAARAIGSVVRVLPKSWAQSR